MLFQSTQHLDTSAKFYPGMLYAIGGLLKVEARNYIDTMKKNNSSFETASPNTVEDSEMEKRLEQTKRELSPSDLKFFEHEFINHLSTFVKGFRAMVKPLTGDRFEFYQ